MTVGAGLGDAVSGGNSHGVGAAFADLDDDGWPDLVIANGRRNRSETTWRTEHWRNRRDGTFEEIGTHSGLGSLAAMVGADLYSVAAGDIDADGDLDLYFGAQPRDILLVNQGNGTFADQTVAAGAGGPLSNPAEVADGRSKIGVFGDVDGDADLDIVVASSTLPSPGAYLLLNDGTGHFEDATAAWGMKIAGSGHPCAVLLSDYDNDGDADLWIWNDRGGHVLLRNEGDRFADVTTATGLDEVTIRHPMGIDSADMDHDGDLDTYVSNIRNNPLLRNDGDRFTDITGAAGTGGDFGWGLGFEDLDLDTWPDLFVAQEDNLPYLSFHHRGDLPPTFVRREHAHQPVISTSAAHNVAVAFGDYDRDGRVDVFSAKTDGSRPTLHRNVTDVGSHRWLTVEVGSAPGDGARGGVGVRVIVRAGELVQFREIYGGSSRASQNELAARFGLGHHTGAEWVAVQWPDGRRRVVTGVAGDQRINISDSFTPATE